MSAITYKPDDDARRFSSSRKISTPPSKEKIELHLESLSEDDRSFLENLFPNDCLPFNTGNNK